MEYPKNHSDFLCIHTVVKLTVLICKENACTCDLSSSQYTHATIGQSNQHLFLPCMLLTYQ